MTPDELIAETLRLDGEATKGPWSYATWPKTSDGRQSPSIIADGGYGVLACDGPENGPHSRDAEAITVYRAAAPRLARMLEVMVSATQYIKSPNMVEPWWFPYRIESAGKEDTQVVVRWALAKIERIAKEEA